jgi:hypothetical protein
MKYRVAARTTGVDMGGGALDAAQDSK